MAHKNIRYIKRVSKNIKKRGSGANLSIIIFLIEIFIEIIVYSHAIVKIIYRIEIQ